MPPTRRPGRPSRPAARLLLTALLTAVLGVSLGACRALGPGGASSASSVAPGSSEAAGSASTGGDGAGVVASGLAAVEAIRERVGLFDTFGIRRGDMIGQSSWWTADPVGQDWRVVFEAGWGDCQAGCIDRHRWTWLVRRDATLVFGGEEGSPLTEAMLQALETSGQGRTGVAGRATGGPTCPVERPGDPACAPRLVGGVVLVVRDEAGNEVGRVTTDGSGYFRLALDPGDLVLEAPPVEGFMGAPAGQPFTVVSGSETWLDVVYDTGIR